MDIAQLEAAAAQTAGERWELYRDVVAATTPGGRATPNFSEKLTAAATADEFIESVY